MTTEQAAEPVLCFRAELLAGRTSQSGLFYDSNLHERMMRALEVKPRGDVETDKAWKQLVVYVVIRTGDRLFSYVRTGEGEPRLAGRRSIGVGGHANAGDVRSNATYAALLEEAVWRELQEEITIDRAECTTPRLLGFISDSTEEVNDVHFGVIWLLDVKLADIGAHPDGGVSKPEMKPLDELLGLYDSYEKWSQLVIEFLDQACPRNNGGLLPDTALDKVLLPGKSQWDGLDRFRRLLIQPLNPDSVTTIGYDLTVGGTYYLCIPGLFGGFKRRDHQPWGAKIRVRPGAMVAIKTAETVGMPLSHMLSGLIVSKVSVAEKGFSHVSTSVDSDWYGNLLVTITNTTSRTLELKVGERFCTLVVFRNAVPSTRPCGKSQEAHEAVLVDYWKRSVSWGRWEAFLALSLQVGVAVVSISYLFWRPGRGTSSPVTAADVATLGAIYAILIALVNWATTNFLRLPPLKPPKDLSSSD